MSNNTTNSGHYNSGHYNSGNCNPGNGNSGNGNSGNRNSGDYNSGDYNSGHCNSGDYNSGNCNPGNGNSGNRNSGNCNPGNGNSGHYNSGDYNSGYFNTDEPTVRLFNKDSGLKRSELQIPYLSLPTTQWVFTDDMTDKEKVDNPKFHVAGGYLKTLNYKEAWQEAWKTLSQATKQRFLDLPNFCPKIFKEITGIDVASEETIDIEINGQKTKISKTSAEALKHLLDRTL